MNYNNFEGGAKLLAKGNYTKVYINDMYPEIVMRVTNNSDYDIKNIILEYLNNLDIKIQIPKDIKIEYYGNKFIIFSERIYNAQKIQQQYLRNINIDYEVGKFMSYLHYYIKNDAVDIEFFIGNLYNKKDNIFCIDYNLTSFFEDYTDDVINNLIYSIQQQYDSYNDDFVDGYLEVAEKYGFNNIAYKILESIF